jgi:hypothetical protein
VVRACPHDDPQDRCVADFFSSLLSFSIKKYPGKDTTISKYLTPQKTLRMEVADD